MRFFSIALCWVVAFSVSAAPIEPRIVSTTTAKIGALTGPQAFTDQKKVDVCGTDLGIMTVSEASVLWNPSINRWIYSYLNENTSSVELREADHLWGPWTTPHALATARDYPQLYGAFMTPSFLRDNGRTLYFVMSQFGPYNAFLMKAELNLAP